MKRISAYTITELLVVLLISMLVVTCILQLLTYTNIHNISMLKKQDAKREVMRGLNFLKINAMKSRHVDFDGVNIIFTYQHKPSRYIVTGSSTLLVQNNLKDTLRVLSSIADPVYLPSKDLVSASISFYAGQKRYNTIIRKQYYRDYLINQLERREYFFEAITR